MFDFVLKLTELNNPMTKQQEIDFDYLVRNEQRWYRLLVDSEAEIRSSENDLSFYFCFREFRSFVSSVWKLKINLEVDLF